MNIKDAVEEVLGDKDMLKAIFERQRELERKYNVIEKKNGEDVPDQPLDVHSFQGQRRLRALIYRITEELFEAGNCLRNKAWKQSHVKCDEDHFLEELVDALHFMVQLFIELGLSPEEVALLYFKKSQVNKFRQRSNY